MNSNINTQSVRRLPSVTWLIAAFSLAALTAYLLTFTSWGKRQLELRQLSGYRTSIVPFSQDGATVYFRGTDADVINAVPLVQKIVTRHGTSVFKIYVVGDVSDRGMEAIATLIGTRWLILNAESISDDGMESVAKMRALERLVVSGPTITCRGIRSLQRLPALRTLNLYRPDIDDKCLDVFAEMSSLRSLDLYETPVTRRAVTDFRKRRPDLDLIQSQGGEGDAVE